MAPGAAALKTGLRLAAWLPLRASRGGLILAVYAAVLVCASLALPWWRMECRAPQYGQRVLVLGVSPTGVEGDARELDILGHYVGMRNLESFAPVERAVAPFAIALTALIALALPFLRPGWLRRFAMAAVIAVPFGFALDLFVWQQYAVTHLDPSAALNMISNRVQARIIGEYRVAQFRVNASFDAGFWLALVAGANVIGFWLAERRGRPSSGGGVRVSVPAPVAAAVALVVALGSFSGSAAAATLEVGPNGAYRTVGAAIAAAAPGDEVVVKSGTYRERVRIDRPGVLRGEGAAILDAGGRGTVITVQAGGTTVRGLTLRASGTSLLGEDAGIRVVDAPGCTVADNRIEDVLFGVLVIGSAGARIDDNHVTGKPLPIPRRGDGLRLFDSSHSTVSGNRATGDGGGINDGGGTEAWNLASCTITENEADSDQAGGGSGGGVRINGPLEVRNTILARNFNILGGEADCDTSTDLVSFGYNLIQDDADCNVTGDTTGNITGTAPGLGPRADYGGPTATHELLASSQALDAGNPAGCEDTRGVLLATDQRGEPRTLDGDGVGGAICDIGSYERALSLSLLEIPALGPGGSAALVGLLLAAAFVRMRRQS